MSPFVIASLAFASFLVGVGLGVVVVFLFVARDPTIQSVGEDKVIVDRESFDQLCLIAQVKKKSPGLRFDAKGHLKHQLGEEQDDGGL